MADAVRDRQVSARDRIAAHGRMLHAQLRSQASYRLSFALECVGGVFAQGIELIVILALFSQVSSLGGFRVGEVLLMYGLAGISFGLADFAVGALDELPRYVRTGEFDVLLLRPLGSLPQVLTTEVAFRRLGRVLTALGTLGYVLSTVDIHWTIGRVLLVIVTPIAGAVIFSSIWVCAIALTFWVIDGRELANSLTYGGSTLTSYPITVFSTWLRRLLAFVVPAAFVAYYPALALTGHRDPLGAPAWLSWCGPVVAVLAAAVAAQVWKVAVRHYVGTGS